MRIARRSSGFLRVLAVVATSLGIVSAVATASATVVERILAIVGDRPILMSERNVRALPFLLQVYQSYPAGATQAAAISDVNRQVLDAMINDELERKAAINSNLSVTTKEIDNAVEQNARRQNLTADELVREAERSGVTEPQYRDMVRRQLLHFKLLQLRVMNQLRVSEDDLKSAYRAAVMEMRKNAAFRLRWIKISISEGGAASAAKQRAIAEMVSEQARKGADFAELARRYSADAATAASGGLLPSLTPGKLPPMIDRTALGLEVGETSPPLRVGDDVVIIKLVERAPVAIPGYQASRAQLEQIVLSEKMELAGKRWLASLRKRTHIEIRE